MKKKLTKSYDGKWPHEKMFCIIGHEENANQNKMRHYYIVLEWLKIKTHSKINK